MRGFNLRFKRLRRFRAIAFASYFALAFLLCGFMIPISVEHDDVDAVVARAAVDSSISFVSTNNHAILNINPSATGTFGTTSGDADISFNITTDNYSGYTLSARATKTTLDRASDAYISALSSSVTATQFASSGNTPLSNRWGYKPNFYNSSANEERYYPATTTAVILDKTTVANVTAKAYTISLGARVNYEIPSGTYENNTLILEYVANPVPYTVSFVAADGDIVSNVPNNITGQSSSLTSVDIPNNVPTRDAHVFVSWCDVVPTEIAGGQSCSGTTVNPGDTYGINNTQSGNIILYGVWTSNKSCNRGASTINTGVVATDAVCMQDINDNVIASMTTGTQYKLKDERDDKEYFISKLIDGKVWMTQNLGYVLNSSTTLTHYTTDLGYTNNDTSRTWTPTTSSITTTTGWSSSGAAGSIDQDRFHYYTTNSTSSEYAATACSNTELCPHYKAGVYYKYNAAIAENKTGFEQYDTMPDSVCPAGWRLTDGLTQNTYSEYNHLAKLYNYVDVYSDSGSSVIDLEILNSLRSDPTFFARSGYYYSNASQVIGASYLWTRTLVSSSYAFTNSFNSSYFNLKSSLYTDYGAPLRCVARANYGKTTVRFNGNGATSGSKDDIVVDSGYAVRLSDHDFVKPLNKIGSWNTKADGTGTRYELSDGLYLPVGTTNTITLYAQWEPAYEIVYNSNGSTGSTSMSVSHLAVADEEITLYASNYSRTGYGFLGWSTTQINPDAANASTLIANAKIFGPNESIITNSSTLGVSAPANITLYAVWIKSSGTIQDWKGCSSLASSTISDGVITPGGVIGLTDSRDGNTYAVARLVDGNCWMVENLRLDGAHSSDSSMAEGFGGVFSGLATESENIFSNNTTANSKYSSSNITGDYVGTRLPRYNSINTASTVSDMTASNQYIYSYGNYYNWPAAMANTESMVRNYGKNTSICPHGWSLPYSTTDSSSTNVFYSLVNTLSGVSRGSYSATTSPTGEVVNKRLSAYPNNLVHAGYLSNSSIYSQGLGGYYWLSYDVYQESAYSYSMTSTGVSMDMASGKATGRSVRCLADSNYRVRYNGNGADAGQEMAVTHDAVSSSSITLFASDYKRDGYGFLGWSFTQINPDAANASSLIANATIYGPNETITLPSVINNDLILYAVWIKSAGNLQGWSGCSSMSVGAVTALKDTRDNQVYGVAKLADENCWMIENLRLDSEYSSDSTKAQGFGGVFVGLPTATGVSSFSANTVSSSLYTADPLNTELNIVAGSNQQYRLPRYENLNTKYAVSTMMSGDYNVYSYGNYYSYASAIANTSEINSASNSSNIGSSICPAGWRLPTSDPSSNTTSTKDLNKVIRVINSGATNSDTALRTYPNNFIWDGYIGSGMSMPNGRGKAGYILSGTAYDASKFYYISYSTTSTHLATTRDKFVGLPVRCVVASGIEVVLDANDGSGRIARIYGTSGESVTLPTTTSFAQENKTVSSWNTASNGSGTSYTSSYTFSSNTTLYAQWASKYSIVYNGNGASNMSAMKSYDRYNVDQGVSIMLNSSLYTRSGYGFAGWSTTQIDPDAANASTLISNAKIFGPNENIVTNSSTLGEDMPATVVLYAVWVKPVGNLQDWNGCDAMTAATYSNGTITAGDIIALTDTRDNIAYAVAKLSDGRCWIIEPMRTNPRYANITAENTNHPTQEFLTKRTSSYSWCSTYSEDCVDRVLGTYVNASYMYNYYTSTAGNSSYSTATTDGVLGDLCPSGWNSPSPSGSEFATLNTSLGGSATGATTSSSPTASVLSARLRTFPNNFRLDGYYNGSAVQLYRSYGGIAMRGVLSTGSSEKYNYYGSYSSSSVLYASSTNAYRGTSLVCLKKSKQVKYDGNGADSGYSMLVSHDAAPNASITLFASNYKRQGYGFAGWSFTQINPDSANAATEIANATIYGPMETITLPSTITSDLTLYAVWIKSAGNLQDWSGCSSLSQGSVTALKDTRDNQVYAVAKLADGNCWMIENLRLNSTNSTDNSKAQGFGGAFMGLPNSELASFMASTVANSLYTTDISSSSLNVISGGDNLQYRIPRFNDASSSAVASQTSNVQTIYSYGNYYNFAAAMANTGEIATAASSEWSGTSICPKGWRLPTGGASGAGKEYEALNTAANSGSTTSSTGIRSFPNNFIYSGYVWTGAVSGRGTYGQYTSGTSSSGSGFFEYQVSPTSVNVGRSVYRSIGDSVRCIANTGVTITLNSNDGNEKVARIYVASGTAVTLPTDVFGYENHKITSWNTATGGTGTSYTSITPTGNVTLYAQWSPAYTITYNGNNATGTTNMNSMSHTGVLNGDEIVLFANNFIRDGYGFLGWSATQIDPDASNAATLIANAKVFGPNQTIAANSTNLGASAPANVTLYAVWVKATGTFQNWKGCSSLTTSAYDSSTGTITPGSFIALTDTRGTTANTYAIARLPGGNCWMIEDARFNISSDTITKANTNYPTAAFLSNRTGTPSTCTSNAQACNESIIYSNGLDQSRGTYYGWHVATAGNGFHANNSSFGADICPAGWHMPTGGYASAGEYNILLSNIGGSATNYTTTSSPTAATLSARLRSFPINLLYSGYTYGTTTYDYRNVGYYSVGDGWNNGTTYYKYFFGFTNDYVRIAYGQSKSIGHRLRCVYSPTVMYDGNGATSGDMAGFTRLTGSSVVLRSPTFERAGYGFLGWSPTSDGSGTIYGANETVNVSTLNTYADAVGNVKLYAIWIQSAGTLQTWTGCNSLTQPSVNVAVSNKSNVTALTDNRDNRVYVVARLADGNCYMTDNLKLGLSDISTDLTSSNTNLSTTISAATFNGWRTTTTTATATAAAVEHLDTLYRKNVVNYNYCAATANTMCVDTSTTNAAYDICPKGWKMIAGGYNAGDLGGLYNIGYNTSALARKSVVSGGAGLLINGDYSSVNESTVYYSTQTAAANNVYGPYLTSTTWSSGYQTGRTNLNPLKCVYDKPRVDLTIYYGTGVSAITVNGSTVPSGGKVRLDQSATVQLVMYLKADYAFSSWNVSGATVGSSSQSTTLTLGTGTTASITGYATFTGTYMQNLSSSSCTTTPLKVYDSRDMQTYYVKRLDDGNCWMMDNLNLGAASFYNNLTSSNTNLSTTVTYSTFNSWKVTSSASTNAAGEVFLQSGTDSTSNTQYGALYNYYAATAGTITGDSNSTNATYDICPAGWRLPTGGTNSDLSRLNLYYTTYSSLRAPYTSGGAAMAQAGWVGGGSSTTNGWLSWSGTLWSSTVYNSSYRYGFYVDYKPSVQPTAAVIRNGGHSIRCVLKETSIGSLKYLQDYNSFTSAQRTAVLNTMPYDKVYKVLDNRDNQTYDVAKLKDDHIWITQNLNLGSTTLSTNLTSANTNISSTVAYSTFNAWKKTSITPTRTAGEFVAVSGTDSTSGTPYGVMYNYCAATAGTYCSSSGSANASYDICPAGWRLPTSGWGSSYELYGVGIKYQTATELFSPVSSGGAAFVLGGLMTGGSLIQYSGTYGNYWASTYSSSTMMKTWNLDASSLADAQTDRGNAINIRCIGKY